MLALTIRWPQVERFAGTVSISCVSLVKSYSPRKYTLNPSPKFCDSVAEVETLHIGIPAGRGPDRSRKLGVSPVAGSMGQFTVSKGTQGAMVNESYFGSR